MSTTVAVVMGVVVVVVVVVAGSRANYDRTNKLVLHAIVRFIHARSQVLRLLHGKLPPSAYAHHLKRRCHRNVGGHERRHGEDGAS